MINSSQKNNIISNGTFERAVFSSSRGVMFLYLIVSLAFVFIGFQMINGDPTSKDYYSNIFYGWVAIVLFGLGALTLLPIIWLKVPKIILDHSGLRYINLLNKKSWKWTDVGPFFVDTRRIRYNTLYYVCAFTDNNHDLMAVHNQPQTPRHTNADMVIPLNSLSLGKDFDSANEFADTLNAWRDKFGHPEIDISSNGTENRANELIEEKKSKHLKVSLLIFLMMLVIPALFGGAHYFGKLISSL